MKQVPRGPITGILCQRALRAAEQSTRAEYATDEDHAEAHTCNSGRANQGEVFHSKLGWYDALTAGQACLWSATKMVWCSGLGDWLLAGVSWEETDVQGRRT